MNDKPRAELWSHGLDEVVVAHTAIGDVQGEAGRLRLVGEEIEALADRMDFETLSSSLLLARLAVPDEAAHARHCVARARVEAVDWARGPGAPLLAGDGPGALQAAVAAWPGSESPLSLIGAVGGLAASWVARHRGVRVEEADPEAGHAADLLRIALGDRDPTRAAALDDYLVTVSDHGLNASTFTARVVASTEARRPAALSAAVGALSGPRHGGAPGPVLDMLDAIGSVEQARSWAEAELASGRKLMGFGHRVYRQRDPRAAVLERAIARLEAAGLATTRLELARRVEAELVAALAAWRPGRGLSANVEFYTAVLLEALGLPRAAFTVVFAAGRVAGWCAHIEEQRKVGRIVRPRARYVGL